MAVASPGTYDWTSLIVLPILAAVIIGILYTTSIVSNVYYRIAAYLLSLVIVGLFIYGAAAASIAAPAPTTSQQAVSESRDPFTYDPGETATGVVVFNGNAAALPTQYNCNLKSSHTVFEDGQCNCATGFYGRMCEYQGFGDDYVSLTTNTVATLTAMPSQPAPTLSSWPTATTVTGCTNICTSNPQCVGVTYANGTCTQYSAISFPSAPIQTNIDPPVLDTTLYLNKSRLLAVNLQGYFNVIFGVLPVRYFVGNGITSATSTNVHVTSGGSRINYYPVGVQSSFAGIPDWVIVGTPGTLYISPNQIPPRGSIVPGQGTLVALTAPIIVPKDRFPYTQNGVSYWVRLDAP